MASDTLKRVFVKADDTAIIHCPACQLAKTDVVGHHALEVGQQIRSTFTLDDKKQTEISKLVIVQSVTDNIIGCRFADNEPLEQVLCFYLFP